jgi:CotH kinase protein/Lamin Tail Domain/Chitobiase/beta-hexosaminidase C-terminal domain/Secretion system C-terminal sorting domain/SprB repeat/Divergent InlB B-repeat domain
MNKLTPICKALFLFFLFTMSNGFLSAQQLFINEFLASNSNVNADEFGENDDWVEIYNASSNAISLTGMFFTDDIINTTKWAFAPGTSIPANGFLLLWCDDQTTQGSLHTNFKLSGSGETIALVAANATTIIDSYTFGPQTANVSQGRQTNGGTPWVSFSSPTPKASNNGNTSTVAAMPVASMVGGHYNSSISVSLTTTTSGASIRYTLDGSEPISTSPLYNNPLNINSTKVLRARAFKSGMTPSRTMTHTYLYGISHTMPIFCISTDDDNFFGPEGIYTLWDEDFEKPAHIELYEADGTFGFRQDLAVEVHGGFSQSYPHKGLAFTARNEYGNNKINYPLFPDLPYTQYGAFLLRASGNDWSKTLFRDALAANLVYDLTDVDTMIKDPDLEFQGYRPTVVYLNGEYFGIHNLREKLDWRYVETHYGYDKEDVDIVQREDDLEHGNLDAWTEYRNFIEDADFTNPNDLATIESWISLDHYIDYFLHNIYVENNDWPDNNNKSWRLRLPGEKWRYFLYDMDRGFGLIPLGGDYNSGDWTGRSLEMVMAETQTADHNAEWSTLLLRKLMLNEGFRLKFINRMADLLNILYTPERVIGRINAFEDVYDPEIDQHADKWWGNNYYTTNVNRARIFATNRTDEMWEQFDDFYTDITAVVDLEMTASPVAGGKIHLNTINLGQNNFPWNGLYFEGVDVPLYAAPNPGYIFTGWAPASLGNNAVTTMNLDGDEEITANFVLGSTQIGNVVINEINYHSPDNCDAGDWVELYNAGNQPINISGWFLEDEAGNYFSLPANTILAGQGFLVLAEDAVRFQNVHPTVTNVIAGFGNSLTGNMGLSNGGEWISINNANRTFRDTVRYDDIAPWPIQPDGLGPSLQLINHTLDNALASSWVASPSAKGTPGQPNQGSLYLGENLLLCTAENITLDATYSPCFGCTFNWSSGATTASINVIPSPGVNNYAVTVTDAGGSSQVDEVTISLSNPFSLNATQQNLACYENNNGSINLSVNGTGTYNYIWTTGATTQDIQNLTVGSYTVTVTNALFCTETETITITAPPALASSSNVTEINCYGDLGAIDISISGGMPGYTYLWSNGATSQDLSNLPEGDYTITISDQSNCSKSLNFSLEEPAQLSGTFDIENGCNGLNTGVIDADITGGTGSYLYSWSNGISGASDNISNLSAGDYTLTVSDANGCTWTNTAEVVISDAMLGNATITNTTCIGTNNGAIALNISGGTAPYSYAWNTGGNTTQIQNLLSGNYTVTVTDVIGCQHTETFSVGAPAPILAPASITAISCSGATDAAISVSPSGGNGGYTYNWNTGSNTTVINNLNFGSYTLTITDGMNCSATFSYAINEVLPLEATMHIYGINCNGAASGAISVIPEGGTAPYNYLWNTNATTATLSNLTVGSYTVTISDANNCSLTQNATVTQNAAIANTISQTNILCNNASTGNIAISTTGGAGPYDYDWSNGSSTANLNNLSAGSYTVTISDNNNCTAVESISLTQPTALTTNLVQNGLICHGGENGSLMVAPTGAVSPYTFAWSTGATTAGINNLTAGQYSITITDNNGCTVTETPTLVDPEDINLFINSTNISCNGMNNGLATALPALSGSYTYQWNTGASSQSISNLAPFTYSVTVTNTSGCTDVASVTLTQPSVLSSTLSSNQINCANGQDGSITVLPSGGVGFYTYLWNTGATTQNLINLNAGTYSVTLSDAAACTMVQSITLSNPSPVSAFSNNTNVTCFGGVNGGIQLSTSGGNAPYQYLWTNSFTSAAISNLAAGSYTSTITDNNGCTLVYNTTITSPNAIDANTQITAINCSDSNNGIIDLSPNGGFGAYTYNWNTGAITQDLTNVSDGNYSVTITDGNNCTLVENILVFEPSPLESTYNTTNPACFGESNGLVSLSINGGVSPYNYLWNTGQTTPQLSNLAAGNYTVTITDNNSCTKVQEIYLGQPAALAYTNFLLVNNNCFGNNNGIISLMASGGNGNYNYQWSNGSSQNSINALTAGNYSVTISDANNCTFSESFVINQPDALTVFETTTSVSCFGDTDGTIEINIQGGTGLYQINWNTGATSNSIANLAGGNYMVTVTDELACTAINTIVVNEAAPLSSSYTLSPISCNGMSDGSISVLANGGTAPYQYTWSNGFNGSNPINLTVGDYSVTITDAHNCIYSETLTLSEPAALEASFEVFHNNCLGDESGAISAFVTGGVMPYSFNWSNGADTSLIDHLPAGEYSVLIADANNCVFEQVFTISEINILEPNSTVENISCFGGADGQVILEVTGGTPAYEFNWSNGATTGSIEGLSLGTYLVTVTDMAGCTIMLAYQISEAAELTSTVQSTNPSSTTGGSIQIIPSGGTAPYNISWDNGATTFVISNLPAGEYNYIVTDANGCTTESSVMLSTSSLPGISDQALHIYPNPTSGRVNIQSELVDMEISVVDVLGRILLLKKDSMNTSIDLSGFANGVYFIRVKVATGERVERMVVERK